MLQRRVKEEDTKYKLKQQDNYFHQVQFQFYCVNREWCDFVVRTERDLHVERILETGNGGANGCLNLKHRGG